MIGLLLFGEEYYYLQLCFWLFWRGFAGFFLYSCSKSLREHKYAINNQFFLYLGGLGAKLRF